jgi:hypothetical protein
VHTGYSEDSLPKIVDAANRLLREPEPDAAVARATEALPASGDAGGVAGGGDGGEAGD